MRFPPDEEGGAANSRHKKLNETCAQVKGINRNMTLGLPADISIA